MRVGAAAFVMAIAGCATVDPARIGLTVDTAQSKCDTDAHTVDVQVTVRNDSHAKLKLSIDSTEHQPPYELNWLSFRILNEDRARLTIPFYALKPDDYAKIYVIQLEDRRDHQFTTAPFKLCDVSQHGGRRLSR
jgi:hypothetical protein